MDIKALLCKLGSTHSGSAHWRAQRYSAFALIPVVVWFVLSVMCMQHKEYQVVLDWFGHPINALLLMVLLVTVFYHGALGLHSVIEDYVPDDKNKFYSIFAVNAASLVLCAIGVVAVLKIAL